MSGFRAVAVVAFSLFVLAATFPNISDAWHPVLADLGFVTAPDNSIVGVEPNSPATKAGLRVGDRFDPSRNSARERLMLAWAGGSIYPRPGETVRVYVVRKSGTVAVPVVARVNPEFDLIVILKRLTGLIFILVGTLLLLRKPSRMTWGIYLYALGNNAADPLMFQFLSPPWYFALDAVVQWIPAALAPVGLLIFALRFPSGNCDGWRLTVDRMAPVLSLVLIFLAFYPAYAWVFSARNSLTSSLWTSVPGGIVLTVAFAILLSTYFMSAGVERQRISWVVGGFAISYVANIVLVVANYLTAWTSSITPDIILTLNLAVPFTVAYSIIRHRILDINFVINRALVYGGVTIIIVGVFVLIDWVFTRTLSSRLGLFADIAAALIIGITLDRLHHRIDHFMDSVFFRRRHLAEMRLKRLTAALPHAASLAAVDKAVVEEPADWLQLASAAIFRREPGSRYVRRESAGWNETMCEALTVDDRLVLQLEAEQIGLRVDDVHWKRTDVPDGAARPALAMPIVIRRRLEGFALYGSHRAGEAIDPDEEKALENLMMGAAAAYDHLEADALREENRRLREERITAGARIDAEHVLG